MGVPLSTTQFVSTAVHQVPPGSNRRPSPAIPLTLSERTLVHFNAIAPYGCYLTSISSALQFLSLMKPTTETTVRHIARSSSYLTVENWNSPSPYFVDRTRLCVSVTEPCDIILVDERQAPAFERSAARTKVDPACMTHCERPRCRSRTVNTVSRTTMFQQ